MKTVITSSGNSDRTTSHTAPNQKMGWIGLAVALGWAVCGCQPGSGSAPRPAQHPPTAEVLMEGPIYYVHYELEGDRTGGFTRLNSNDAVPGGNGSWNVDAYGKLTREYLFVSRPQQPDLSMRVIPREKLISIQFGDGGIKKLDENKPNPGNL